MKLTFSIAIATFIGITAAGLGLSAPALAAGTAVDNWALHFDGPGTSGRNYVSTDTSPALTSNFTLSADVRWDGTTGYTIAVSRPFEDSSANSQTGIVLGVVDGKPAFGLKAGPEGENRLIVSPSMLTANQWSTLIGVYTGTTLTLFVDGNKEISQTYGKNLDIYSGQTRWVLGREFAYSDHPDLVGRGFHGDIDNVAISAGVYPAPLTTLVRYTLSEGSGLTTADSTAGGRTGTLSTADTPTWVTGSDRMAIHYVLNGGTGSAPIQTTARTGSSFSVESSSLFSRAGYRFTGWSDGTGTLQPGELVTVGRSEVVLTAMWDAEPTPALAATGTDSSSLWTTGLLGLALLVGSAAWLFLARPRRSPRAPTKTHGTRQKQADEGHAKPDRYGPPELV
jgi:hypothetical protein